MRAGHWAVLILLLVVPGCASLFQAFGAHDISRVAQILVSTIAALAVVWSALARRADERLGSSGVTVTSVALSLALLSVWHAPESAAAMRELAMFLGLGGIAAVVARSPGKPQLELLAIVAMVAALLNAALIVMLMLSVVVQAHTLDLFTVVPGYDNPRFLNHVQTVMLPLSAIAASQSFRQGEFSRLAWAAMTLNFALIFFTQGRATGLALMGASLLALLLFGRTAVPLLLRLAIAASVGFLIHMVLFVWVPSLLGAMPESWRAVTDTRSFQERLNLWRLAVGYLVQEPWLGIGPMHFAHHLNPTAAHPHNIYLQIASEWGLPMLLGVIVCVAWAMRRMARTIVTSHDSERTMGIALFCALAAVAIDGVFSGNFVMPVSQVWIAFAAGWAIAWTRSNSSSVVSRNGVQRWPLTAGAALSLLVLSVQAWLWWSIAPEIADLSRHLEQVNTKFLNSAPQAARFWSTGWF